MYYDFREDKLDLVLKKHKGLRRLLSPKLKTMPCPYDGITFYTDRSITPEFFSIVKPAMFSTRLSDAVRRYRYILKHRLFTVLWMPQNVDHSQTIIRLNPHKNKYTPAQVLDLISFIVGDYSDVYVGRFDEKVDLPDCTVEDVVKRLHVPYKRKKPLDYKNKNETFYFGSRKRQQVKVYNKGKQQGQSKKLVRIERTKWYEKTKRHMVADFFLNSRHDIMKGLVLVDTEKIDNRTSIKKLLKTSKTFYEAYKLLDDKRKKELKRHPAFIQPLIDIQQLVRNELRAWLVLSPRLFFKVHIDRIKPVFDAWAAGTWRFDKTIEVSPILKRNPQSRHGYLATSGWGVSCPNFIKKGGVNFDKTMLII
ncbi:hypothetical protein QYF48_17255 [Brevibacillus agri]|uniref:hypothetical protein n=1 Tax=Brevibacillus agri TaxID=51101 RepID=UPI0002A5044C|nr:hypothetical protein [Brevibacillus agri]ELK41471.1 hypothetical protein D478_13708 [Brevibacillus agri BAB-2500]MDN4094557.1 hypothetical protein [Brevibacillus agri]